MLNIRNTLPFLALLPLVAISAEKHVHGEAELFVAVENGQVLLELESPADNILGFEYAPKTQAQHKLLDSSLDKLRDYSHVIAFPKGACKQVNADVESPFKEHHDEEHSEHKEHAHDKHEEHDEHEEHAHDEHEEHEKHEEHHDHGDSNDVHSGFHVTYTLQCDKNIQDAFTATVSAFEHFDGFAKIQVNWVTPNKQGSVITTPTKASVTIK